MNRSLVFISLLLLVSGCKVGPNYAPPPTLVPACFVEDQPDRTVPVSDEDLVHWWVDTFQDPFLDQLLEETLSCNLDLRIALERVFQARANYWIQFTSILPDFESDFQATRFRTSQAFDSQRSPSALGLSPIQNFFQIGIDAVWQLDLFGQLRRSAQSAYYAWEATIEDEKAIKLTVLSEAASVYVAICYFQTKLELAQRLIAYDEGLVAMSQERFRSGLADEGELVETLSTLEADQASSKIFETALKQNIYSLAVLLGRLPETLIDDFCVSRPLPIASGKIPETLPADLLRRRPDIASAERQLAAQTEQIGVAVADLFPTVSLIGSSSSFAANPLQGANIGYSTDTFSKLFTLPSRIWGVGTLIVWPVFDFGKRVANIKVQKFLTNQAYLSYKKTVILAFQEVEIALATYFNEEERFAYFTKQALFDQRNLELIADQFQAGLASYTQVLQAMETWLISENARTDSQQALDSDLITVYKALGGDW